MAVSIKRNRMSDASATFEANHIRDVERIVVEGLAAGNDLLLRAKQAPGVPTPGLPHDLLPGVRVKKITARPLSTTSAELIVESETPDALEQPPIGAGNGWTIRNVSSISQVSTEIDADGKVIRVVYTQPGDNRGDTKVPSVTYFRPMRTLIASTSRTKLTPDQWYDTIGKVNSAPWYGSKRGYWLCSGVTDQTRDGGNTYAVELTFVRNPESWASYAIYVDPNGNRAHISDGDAARVKNGEYETYIGNGVTKVRVYGEANFGDIFNLNLR